MRIALFYHSLVSDWNNGNAHFLRGIASEIMARGHELVVYVPRGGWSVTNLIQHYGEGAVTAFQQRYPELANQEQEYTLADLDLERALDAVDLVIVHEWNAHELVQRIGEHRSRHRGYRLLFHDTHHRSFTDSQSMAAYDLQHYDGVLAFGEVIRDRYLTEGWAQQAWVWHEAADTRIFHPLDDRPREAEVVWVGNWGDEERTSELYEFLFDPVMEEQLRTNVYGVRYPQQAQAQLRERGITYRGWLENSRVPEVFARHCVTVHIPRRPYVEALPGIPTIRPFEALACKIPLVCTPWEDAEGLFTPGEDFLIARNGEEMRRCLREIINDRDRAAELASHGYRTLLGAHTCAHRVDELLSIYHELNVSHESQPHLRK
ncbi:CgeB family protein [Nitrosococcus wardiae]|uniref:Glycosyltransferase n=1 Tax=Nitrosococcus wardiae TaxID=1814290 RepID=A0A4P7C269_9GAMM|nr:glycosyltransferase [Nitrosococcus wardiae]QBQ55740.1 glycosyltransferase [Nitrosococcus wardiae]